MLASLQRFPRLVESRRQGFDALVAATNLDQTLSWTRCNRLQGFNRSAVRLRIIYEMAKAFGATHFVETGTYHAATSICAHRCLGLPVWSCELSRTKHWVAKAVTLGMGGIELARLDSRSFLHGVVRKLRHRTDMLAMFYLDAHDDGGAESTTCPLMEELALVLSLDSFLAIIDDFAVPASEFISQRYGGVELCVQSISDTLSLSGVRRVFFPNYPASLETGQGRAGYTVFFRSASLEQEMGKAVFPLSLLSPFEL